MSVSTLRLGRAWLALPKAASWRPSEGSSSGSVASCQPQEHVGGLVGITEQAGQA